MRRLGKGVTSALDLSKKPARAALMITGGYASEVRSQFKLIGADLALYGNQSDCLDPHLRPLWEAVAICAWNGEACSMPQWGQRRMDSLPPAGRRTPDMTQLFSEMDNPYSQELPTR